MEIEFDLVKSELSRLRRGLPYSMVESFDFETALYRLDVRRDSGIRVISLRKANRREVNVMSKKLNNAKLIDEENPAWTEANFKRVMRIDALPDTLQKKLRGQRGPQKAPTKIQTAVRYDADIIEAFKAGGPGWQTRMNDALREWLHGRERV